VTVYESDPDAAPDDEFEPGNLRHLVPGNRGRLLDPRRTGIALRTVDAEKGTFEVEVTAFEDAGAVWEIEAERMDRFQFVPGQPTADASLVAALEDAIERFDRPLAVPADGDRRAATERDIAAAQPDARSFLPGDSPFEALDAYLRALGLAELDEAFAAQFVSNPRSGERVKGHAIVVARLGLCAFAGKAIRTADLFDGDWSEERRAAHVVARLAFVRELFTLDGVDHVTLYRGVSSDRPLEPPQLASFVSATFEATVAEAHFAGGPTTVAAALYRQRVPVSRLFMTHRETAAMNRRFREAEAVLLGDPASPLF
jgi:hypothetical protein